MHQTSSTALASAMREINRRMGARVCHPGNTIDNLARRGNTSSTTHFVALADSLATGRIRSGDRVIFAVSGSGLTVGTALYTFDDLPDRLRAPSAAPSPWQGSHPATNGPHRVESSLVRVISVGTVPGPTAGSEDTLTLLRRAALDCLGRSSFDRGDLGLLIYAGVYRSAYLTEPAIAALLAGELEINATMSDTDARRTLAFDIFNGAVGFLNACHVAAEMIRAGRVSSAMVVTAEIENNADAFPEQMLGIEETGSAVILARADGHAAGFGAFMFRSYTDHAEAFTSHCINRDATTCLVVVRHPELEACYIACIVPAVTELLEAEGLPIGRITRILAPQISPEFITGLSRALDLPRERFVDATSGRRDLFTSSVPFAFRSIIDQGLAKPGEIGLVVTVGSGIQVGCALYHF